MSIATKLQAILSAKGDIKAAIESKGVSVGSASLDQYASKIGQISGGGGDVEEDYMDDVIFIDYDGKVLYRYTAQEFLALTEMPANPTHGGLTAQGWNWSLADAKTYVTDTGGIVIGQMYITSDEKHHFHITLDDSNYLSPSVYLYGGNIINWGDGSAEETATSSGYVQHTYSNTGNYVIKITPDATTGYALYGSPISSSDRQSELIYKSTLKKAFIGKVGSSLSTYFLQDCFNLQYITLPDNITSFGSGALCSRCLSLIALTIPPGITNAGAVNGQVCVSLKILSLNKLYVPGANNFTNTCSLKRLCLSPSMIDSTSWQSGFTALNSAKRVEILSSCSVVRSFAGAYSLEYIKLPNSATEFPNNCFQNSYSLRAITLPSSLTTIGQRVFESTGCPEITIPSSVTSIGNYAFYSSGHLDIVHVLAPTPPTAGTGIFQSSSVTHIYVPSESVETYKGASGWSAYASLIEAEPTT